MIACRAADFPFHGEQSRDDSFESLYSSWFRENSINQAVVSRTSCNLNCSNKNVMQFWRSHLEGFSFLCIDPKYLSSKWSVGVVSLQELTWDRHLSFVCLNWHRKNIPQCSSKGGCMHDYQLMSPELDFIY